MNYGECDSDPNILKLLGRLNFDQSFNFFSTFTRVLLFHVSGKWIGGEQYAGLLISS